MLIIKIIVVTELVEIVLCVVLFFLIRRFNNEVQHRDAKIAKILV